MVLLTARVYYHEDTHKAGPETDAEKIQDIRSTAEFAEPSKVYTESRTQQAGPKTDAERIQDVHYIAELVEQYKEKTGSYPYHHWFEDVKEGYVVVPVGVNITDQTLPEQYRYPPPGVSGYVDSTEEFLKNLRYVLGNKVNVPYDDRPVVYEPPYIPTFYQYHYDGNDYFVSAILTAPNQYTRELRKGYYKYQVGSTESVKWKTRNYTKLRKQREKMEQ